MEQYWITYKEACPYLDYGQTDKEVKKCADFIRSVGFLRPKKGMVIKQQILDYVTGKITKEDLKCTSEKEANTTTSRVRYVWATKPLKSKSTVQALLNLKKQESMQTEQLPT